LTRRQFTQAASVLATTTSLGRAWAADTLKIGYVSPQTGPLAAFGEADKWVVEQMRLAFSNGISVGGKR
jgi:branched-chain amino acid transport system substrate-binding protein